MENINSDIEGDDVYEESLPADDQYEGTEEVYEPEPEEELTEPDYETATPYQLIEWCQYLKYKFEVYINQTNDREALFMSEIQTRSIRIDELEHENYNMNIAHDEEVEHLTKRLNSHEYDYQQLEQKWIEAKTSLINLTKGFRQRENELKTEVSALHRSLRKLYDMNIYIRDGIRIICEKLCGELVTVEDVYRSVDTLIRSLNDTEIIPPPSSSSALSLVEATSSPEETPSSHMMHISSLEQKILSLQAEFHTIEESHRHDISSYKVQLQDQADEIERLKSAFDESQSLLETSSDAIISSSAHYKQLQDDKVNEIQDMQHKLEKMRHEMLLRANEAHERKIEGDNIVSAHDYTIKQQQEEITKIQHHIQASDHRIAELTAEIEVINQEKSSYKDDIKSYKDEIISLQAQLKSSSYDISSLSQQLQANQVIMQKLESNLFHSESSSTDDGDDDVDDNDEMMTGWENYDDCMIDMESFAHHMDTMMTKLSSKSDTLSLNMKSFTEQSHYLQNKATDLRAICSE